MKKIKLKRYEQNPIISPSYNWWETRATFNAGAVEYQGKIVLLYRAIGNDGISRFGFAITSDGKNVEERRDSPVLEPSPDDPLERLGIEDPRITKIDDTYYISYIASSVYKASHESPLSRFLNKRHSNYAPWRIRGSLARTKDFKSFERLGRVFGDMDNKDIVLFPEKIDGKYYILDRIYPNMTISSSDELEGEWSERKIVMEPSKGWEEERVGASTVPLKTDKGWLVIYHAADKKQVYRLGLLFLDLNDPSKVIYRHSDPILEPEEEYEKMGKTLNVVFSCGMVEIDDQYYVYYGAADRVIGLATIGKDKLLSIL